MNKDTHDLDWKDHAPMLLLALCWLAFIGHLYWKAPAPLPQLSTLSSQPLPATTTQAYYEQERAGLHDLEATDLETTEQKLDRIRRRDLSARSSSQLSTLNSQPSSTP